MGRFAVRDALRKPEFLTGCLGLAMCLCIRDLPQFLSFETYSATVASQYLVAAGRLLPMLALAFAAWRSLRPGAGGTLVSWARLLVFAGSGLEVAGICLQAFAPVGALHFLGFFILGLGQSSLVAGWVVSLLTLGRRSLFVAFMLAFFAAGVFEVFLATVSSYMIVYLVAAIPLFSCALFVASSGFQKDGVPFAVPSSERPLDPAAPAPLASGRLLLVLFTFFGYSFIARQLTDTWMVHGTADTLFVFQLCGALGTAFAALVVYLAFRLRRAYKNSAVYTVFAIFAVTVAIYLSTFLIDVWSALFLVPLYVLRKTILFLATMTAHGQGRGARAELFFFLAFVFVEAGNLFQTAFFEALDVLNAPVDLVTSVSLLAVAVFIVVVEWSAFYRGVEGGFRAREAGGDVGSLPGEQERAVKQLAERCQLSAREAEVLSYLAAGRNAEYIAKALGVAPSTAKTHIAHIYRKTGHNSQQRLMDTIDELASGA